MKNYSQHGQGQIDFAIYGNDLIADKSGEIVYVRDDHSMHGCDADFARYNNVIVIKHAEDEYSLYLHVQQNSFPQYLKDTYNTNGSVHVEQGTYIGVEGNIGWSCGATGIHLHLSTTSNDFVTNKPDILD
jgi:murein DD-endopeptidase MepM/ murein hydrolase activator NlpD